MKKLEPRDFKLYLKAMRFEILIYFVHFSIFPKYFLLLKNKIYCKNDWYRLQWPLLTEHEHYTEKAYAHQTVISKEVDYENCFFLSMTSINVWKYIMTRVLDFSITVFQTCKYKNKLIWWKYMVLVKVIW